MSHFDDALNRAFEGLSERLRAELKHAAVELAAALQAERDQVERDVAGPGASTGTDAASAGARVLEGVQTIGAAASLSEVLDTLAATAAREASRAAVLLVRGRDIVPWRFVGFPGSFDVPASVPVPIADAGFIAEALRAGAAVSATSAPLFAPLPVGAHCLAVPIVVGGETVGVLYADEGFEAGRDPAWPQRVEVLARYAARCLEAITAFRSVQLTRAGLPTADPPGEAAAPTGADAAAAQRYARLLVSEIKLYHEPEVLAGRKARDLAIRLAGEIARARSLYEQRVPPQAGERTDYFHAELVRTLADGDAALLEMT